jgi:hypothetical protein
VTGALGKAKAGQTVSREWGRDPGNPDLGPREIYEVKPDTEDSIRQGGERSYWLGKLDTVISSAEDLVRFTRERASEEPQFADELELRLPGLSPAELDRLVAALPAIPAS